MNGLDRLVARVRRRALLRRVVLACAAAVASASAAMTVALVVDAQFQLGDAVRRGVSYGVAGLVVVILVAGIVRRRRRRERVLRDVEVAVGLSHGALVIADQLARRGPDRVDGVEARSRRMVGERAEGLADGVRASAVVGGVFESGLLRLCGGVLVAVVGFGFAESRLVGMTAVRFVEPGGGHPPYCATAYAITTVPGSPRVGMPVRVVVEAGLVVPRDVVVEVESAAGRSVLPTVRRSAVAGGRIASSSSGGGASGGGSGGGWFAEISRLDGPVRVRAVGSTGVSGWVLVEPSMSPTVLEGVSVVSPMGYTGLAERRTAHGEDTTVELRGAEGASVRYEVDCNAPLSAVRVVGAGGGESTDVGVEIVGSSAIVTVEGAPAGQWSHELVLVGADGSEGESPIRVGGRFVADKSPTVGFLMDAASTGEGYAHVIGEDLSITVTAGDDYGLSRATVVLRGGDGQEVRVALPVEGERSVEVGAEVAIGEGFAVGDRVRVLVEVADNRPGVLGGAQRAVAGPYEVELVSEGDLEGAVRRGLALEGLVEPFESLAERVIRYAGLLEGGGGGGDGAGAPGALGAPGVVDEHGAILRRIGQVRPESALTDFHAEIIEELALLEDRLGAVPGEARGMAAGLGAESGILAAIARLRLSVGLGSAAQAVPGIATRQRSIADELGATMAEGSARWSAAQGALTEEMVGVVGVFAGLGGEAVERPGVVFEVGAAGVGGVLLDAAEGLPIELARAYRALPAAHAGRLRLELAHDRALLVLLPMCEGIAGGGDVGGAVGVLEEIAGLVADAEAAGVVGLGGVAVLVDDVAVALGALEWWGGAVLPTMGGSALELAAVIEGAGIVEAMRSAGSSMVAGEDAGALRWAQEAAMKLEGLIEEVEGGGSGGGGGGGDTALQIVRAGVGGEEEGAEIGEGEAGLPSAAGQLVENQARSEGGGGGGGGGAADAGEGGESGAGEGGEAGESEGDESDDGGASAGAGDAQSEGSAGSGGELAGSPADGGSGVGSGGGDEGVLSSGGGADGVDGVAVRAVEEGLTPSGLAVYRVLSPTQRALVAEYLRALEALGASQEAGE